MTSPKLAASSASAAMPGAWTPSSLQIKRNGRASSFAGMERSGRAKWVKHKRIIHRHRLTSARFRERPTRDRAGNAAAHARITNRCIRDINPLHAAIQADHKLDAKFAGRIWRTLQQLLVAVADLIQVV